MIINNQETKPSTLVFAMVEGLKKRWVEVNMMTWGQVIGGVCFGCAATNTLCQLKGAAMTVDDIYNEYTRAEFLNIDYDVINSLERAIDELRKGDVSEFFYWLRYAKIETPTNYKLDSIKLPYLYSNYLKTHLTPYTQLAEKLAADGY